VLHEEHESEHLVVGRQEAQAVGGEHHAHPQHGHHHGGAPPPPPAWCGGEPRRARPCTPPPRPPQSAYAHHPHRNAVSGMHSAGALGSRVQPPASSSQNCPGNWLVAACNPPGRHEPWLWHEPCPGCAGAPAAAGHSRIAPFPYAAPRGISPFTRLAPSTRRMHGIMACLQQVRGRAGTVGGWSTTGALSGGKGPRLLPPHCMQWKMHRD